MAVTSVVVSLGMAVHDNLLEQTVATATYPLGVVTFGSRDGEPRALDELHTQSQHAHADYNPMTSMLTNSFLYQSPAIAPRRNSHHKQLLRQIEIAGRHAFDNDNLPIVA